MSINPLQHDAHRENIHSEEPTVSGSSNNDTAAWSSKSAESPTHEQSKHNNGENRDASGGENMSSIAHRCSDKSTLPTSTELAISDDDNKNKRKKKKKPNQSGMPTSNSGATAKALWWNFLQLYSNKNTEDDFLVFEYRRCSARFMFWTLSWILISAASASHNWKYTDDLSFKPRIISAFVVNGLAVFIEAALWALEGWVASGDVAIVPGSSRRNKNATLKQDQSKKRQKGGSQTSVNSSSGGVHSANTKSSATSGATSTDSRDVTQWAMKAENQKQNGTVIPTTLGAIEGDYDDDEQPDLELVEGSNEAIEATDIIRQSSIVEIHIAKVHEVLTILYFFYCAFVFAFDYQYQQNNCIWFRGLHDQGSRSNNDRCNTRLYQLWFFAMLIPLIIGQPRFVHSLWIFCAGFVCLMSILRFHNTTDGGEALLFIIITLYLGFVAFLKHFDERKNRTRFELSRTLGAQSAILEREAKTLLKVSLAITPAIFHQRLVLRKDFSNSKSHPYQSAVDASSQACCLIIELRNFVTFSHTMLPQEAASRLAKVNLCIVHASADHGYHHIKTDGDQNIFVRELFVEDTPQSEEDECSAAKATAAKEGVLFGISICETSTPKVQLAAGLSCGMLVGLPMGRSFIRYDVYGPALQEARELATTVDAGKVSISSTAASRLQAASKKTATGVKQQHQQSSTDPSPTASLMSSLPGVSSTGNSGPNSSSISGQQSSNETSNNTIVQSAEQVDVNSSSPRTTIEKAVSFSTRAELVQWEQAQQQLSSAATTVVDLPKKVSATASNDKTSRLLSSSEMDLRQSVTELEDIGHYSSPASSHAQSGKEFDLTSAEGGDGNNISLPPVDVDQQVSSGSDSSGRKSILNLANTHADDAFDNVLALAGEEEEGTHNLQRSVPHADASPSSVTTASATSPLAGLRHSEMNTVEKLLVQLHRGDETPKGSLHDTNDDRGRDLPEDANSPALGWETQSAGCCGLIIRFANPIVEAKAVTQFRQDHRQSFILINGFLAGFMFLVLLLGLVEREYSNDLNSGSVYAFAIVVALACLLHTFVALATTVESKTITTNGNGGDTAEFSPPPPPTTLRYTLASIATLMASIGTNFSRPSAAGDNVGFLLWVYGFTGLYTGAPLVQTLFVQAIMVVSYFLLMVLYRPMVMRMDFVPAPMLLCMLYITLQHHKRERLFFAGLQRKKHLTAELLRHKKMHEALLTTLLPPQVRSLVPTTRAFDRNSIECWTTHSCIVATIRLTKTPDSVFDELMVTSSGSQQRLMPLGGGREYSASYTYASDSYLASSDPSSFNSDSKGATTATTTTTASKQKKTIVQAIQMAHQHADETLGRIEQTVATVLPNSTLDIVRMFGGSVMVAGPLAYDRSRHAEKARQRRKQANERLGAKNDAVEINDVDDAPTTAQKDEPFVPTDPFTAAAEDVGVLIDSLLRLRNTGVTVGVSDDSVNHALRLCKTPSYDIVGPGVNQSRAIASAAPSGTVAMTERLAELYVREVPPEQKVPLQFGTGQSWRLRDVGSVRVVRAELMDGSTEQ